MPVIIIANKGAQDIRGDAEDDFHTPDSPRPLLVVVPLQLMAYHTVIRGHDVGKPRSLAKRVTVKQRATSRSLALVSLHQ